MSIGLTFEVVCSFPLRQSEQTKKSLVFGKRGGSFGEFCAKYAAKSFNGRGNGCGAAIKRGALHSQNSNSGYILCPKTS